jgi:deoxyadenosine kinase
VWSGRGAVQDRTIYEDAVFARMLSRDGVMSERDYATYVELFERMSNMMRRPTVIVHLDVSPEESKRRIDMRARSCEHGISLEYLTKLHTAYEEFVGEISKVVPVIRVDYRDFVETGKIVDAIKQEYDRMRNVRNITFRGKMTECDSVSDGARPLSSCHPADE